MNKRLQIIILIVSLFLVSISYFLLQPRVSGVFPFIRQYRLAQFIKNTIKNKHISPQEFWQLREFYSPGVITFKKPDLLFKSARIYSHETILGKNVKLSSLVPKNKRNNVIYENENELISTQDDLTTIYFIKPITEMATANGFFDYRDKDKKLLENKNWYVVTQIKQ